MTPQQPHAHPPGEESGSPPGGDAYLDEEQSKVQKRQHERQQRLG